MTGAPAVTDMLALERTLLANERTLLAWVRTGLGFGIAGATALHFGLESEAALGVGLIGLGVMTALTGVVRYRRSAARYAAWREALAGGADPAS